MSIPCLSKNLLGDAVTDRTGFISLVCSCFGILTRQVQNVLTAVTFLFFKCFNPIVIAKRKRTSLVTSRNSQ